MTQPKAIILTGYGLNCEQETAAAFVLADGQADIVHINDLIVNPKILNKYQILAIPGGFSYGDDLGGGKAYGNKLNNHLRDYLQKFSEGDKLILGICNGFQILTQAGLLPGSLVFNDNNRYTDRWVDVKMTQPNYNNSVSSRGSSARPRDPLNMTQAGVVIARNASDEAISGPNAKIASDALAMTKHISPWLKGIDTLSLPIAHGEGKFVADDNVIKDIQKYNQIAGVYYKGEICEYQNLTPNPNGAMLDIAMLTSPNGKILGTMPHPERGIFFTQTPNWPLRKEQLLRKNEKLPEFTEALKIFKNAINYFK